MSRGVWRIFAVALSQYQQTLEAHALLDFSGVLERAVGLLKEMDEFAQSRYRLEARYRHVLVDEFQDTSRAQWELVAQLVRSWGEGFGAAADALPPSIFIVGDRKQSIYGFRDADVAVLDEAAGFIDALRPDGDPRRAISVSFRAVPELLAFVNDVFDAIDKAPERRDAFRYGDADRFPVEAVPIERTRPAAEPLGLIVAGSGSAPPQIASRTRSSACWRRRLVRDRRPASDVPCVPADIAILFRSRDSHREFEKALERRGVPPTSTRASASSTPTRFRTRSRCCAIWPIRCPTCARRRSCGRASSGCPIRPWRRSRRRWPRRSSSRRAAAGRASSARTTTGGARRGSGRPFRAGCRGSIACRRRSCSTGCWRETAYAFETRGPGRRQARENLKKLRGMVARFQNRGYATLARIADHLDELAVGDESNAAIDAVDAVSLMTVHAAKGLEFPIVFVVNMGRGTGGARAPIRVSAGGERRAVGGHCRLPVGSRRGCARRASARRRSACCTWR